MRHSFICLFGSRHAHTIETVLPRTQSSNSVKNRENGRNRRERRWRRERAEGEEWRRERNGGGRGIWQGQKEEKEEGIPSIRRRDPIEVSRVSLP